MPHVADEGLGDFGRQFDRFAPHGDEDRLAVQGKPIPAGQLESAHQDHYKSGAQKHRGRNGHRYFKRGRDYPVVTHGTAFDGLRPCENNDQIWEPERILRTSPIRYVCGDQAANRESALVANCPAGFNDEFDIAG
jgi:hypothetical protein